LHGFLRHLRSPEINWTTHIPEVYTLARNRKPLQRPVAFEATWELRLGPENCFRVFYAVSHERHQAQILAVGTKERNRLVIGREEIKL